MQEFERYVRTTQGGYRLSWGELIEFAQGIDDLVEIHLIGEADSHPREPVYDIQGTDSTEWRIATRSTLHLDTLEVVR